MSLHCVYFDTFTSSAGELNNGNLNSVPMPMPSRQDEPSVSISTMPEVDPLKQQLDQHINLATTAIIDHVEAHGCKDVSLKFKILDLRMLRDELDRLRTESDPAAQEQEIKEELTCARQLVREAEEDIVAYLTALEGSGKMGEVGFQLRIKVLRLKTRLQEWKKLVGAAGSSA